MCAQRHISGCSVRVRVCLALFLCEREKECVFTFCCCVLLYLYEVAIDNCFYSVLAMVPNKTFRKSEEVGFRKSLWVL